MLSPLKPPLNLLLCLYYTFIQLKTKISQLKPICNTTILKQLPIIDYYQCDKLFISLIQLLLDSFRCRITELLQQIGAFLKYLFLLKILAVPSVFTATPERTFSTIKRAKKCLQNFTGQERLSSLALLSAHRNITVYPEKSEISQYFKNIVVYF